MPFWYFKDVRFKFEPHVCNGYHVLLTMAHSLEDIAILSAKGATFRCTLWGISRNEGLRRLNNSLLEDKVVLRMDFSPNKKAIEIIKECAFGSTYFRDIYYGINVKWYKKLLKEFDHLRNIDKKYYCSDYYDVSVNKYGVKCGTSLRSWENNGWINEIGYGWFQ